MVSFVNSAPTAPTVVLVLPLVTCRACVAMTVPVVKSWEEGGRRGEGEERRREEKRVGREGGGRGGGEKGVGRGDVKEKRESLY